MPTSSQQAIFAPSARQAPPALPKGSSAVQVPELTSPKRLCTETTNIWTGDSGNIQYVGEYASDIFASLLKQESKFLPEANYFDLQKDINSKMRGILVDWLIEVHTKYRMRQETLYLTISTVDRFLTRMPVLRSRLQLVGVVALSIAAKYEEINPPTVEDYVYITDNSYTKEEIIAMECHMLSVLDFQVAIPTVAHLLGPLLSINNCDDEHKEFVCYLTELALLDHEMVRCQPSLIICAAILLSNEMAGRTQPWPSSLQEHTKHTDEQLRPCAQQLHKQLQNAPRQRLQAVCKKYQSAAHQRVASNWPRT